MKKSRIVWRTLTFLAITGAASAAELAQTISADIFKQVSTIEIYYQPESALTFTAVSPEELLQSADFKITIYSGFAIQWLRDFDSILRDSKVSPVLSSIDCRWGIVARDKRGRSIYSFFLSAGGITGINQGKVSSWTDTAIRSWFKKTTDCLNREAEKRGVK